MSEFGYVDDIKESSGGTSFGKFGLNKAFITKLEYNPNAGKNDTPADAVDIHVKVQEKTYRNRYYAVGNRIWGKKKGEEGFEDAFNKESNSRMAVIIQAIKSLGITEEDLKEVLSTPKKSFGEWAEAVCSLVPNNLLEIPIHVHLEYQDKPSEGYDVRFLEVPFNFKKTKNSRIYSKFINGTWKMIKSQQGIIYENEQDIIHPISRTGSFMETNRHYKDTPPSENDNVNYGNKDKDEAPW